MRLTPGGTLPPAQAIPFPLPTPYHPARAPPLALLTNSEVENWRYHVVENRTTDGWMNRRTDGRRDTRIEMRRRFLKSQEIFFNLKQLNWKKTGAGTEAEEIG